MQIMLLIELFLSSLPDWNSIDSVRKAHSDLELAGIVFFALLAIAESLAHGSKSDERKHLYDSFGVWFFCIAVACEAVGYWYGQRNDDLSAQIISSLDVKAQKAASNASTALGKSETALSNSKEAETKSGNAIEKAGKADATAHEAAGKAVELKGELSTAKTDLAEVEKKRAEVEASLKNLAVCNSPRVIPVWSMGTPNGAHRFNDPLLPFAGWKAVIEYVPNDAETFRAASSLAKALRNAGWDVALKLSPKALDDGVKVQGYEPDFMNSTGHPDIQSAWAASNTARIVVRFLHSYNWQARLGWMEQDDVTRKLVPPKGILIEIGLYPPVWYVAPPAMKDWSLAETELQKERAEEEQKGIQARKDNEAHFLSTLDPQMAAIMKRDFEADWEREEQERKAELQVRVNPCQPLETLGPY